MNTYAAFYDSRSTTIQAGSAYAAQLAAVAHFKPRRSQQHMVSVVLMERDNGSPVVHSTAGL